MVAEMERAAKLQKLNTFRRILPHVTASALDAILAAVKKFGIPELSDRDSMREAMNMESMSNATPFGPILQYISLITKDGEPKQLPIAHPFALLWNSVASSANLRKFFKDRLVEKPSTPEDPWHLILYSDEVTPGNVLAPMNNRKFQADYFSFLEFGINALSHEESWWCVFIEFSTVVNDLSAGMSQVFCVILKTFFSADGLHLASGGIQLPFQPNALRLFAKIGMFIQDGGAHKTTWHCRGDGASKFCLLCRNVFTASSNIVDEDGSNLLRCNVIKKADLIPARGADMRKTARYLEAKADLIPPMSVDDFTNEQQALGMTHHKHALLLDRSLDHMLDVTKVYMHDWMHGLFVQGVVNITVYLLLEVFIMKGYSCAYESLSGYIKLWRWPGRIHANHLHELFSEGRPKKHRKAHQIKCQASDMLSLIGVIAVFALQVLLPLNLANDACYAFMALADIVDFIVSTSRAKVEPAALDALVEKFLDLFAGAFGIEWMTPKFHWQLHFGDHLKRFKVLVNCFVLERKHRIAKRYATDMKNVSKHANASLLMEVTSHHMALLNAPNVFNFEAGPIAGTPAREHIKTLLAQSLGCADSARVLVSMNSRHSALGFSRKGDVVLIKDGNSVKAGQVLLHASVDGIPVSIVSCWQLHSINHDAGIAKWHVSDSKMLIETTDILDSVCHTELSRKLVTTILPPEFR